VTEFLPALLVVELHPLGELVQRDPRLRLWLRKFGNNGMGKGIGDRCGDNPGSGIGRPSPALHSNYTKLQTVAIVIRVMFTLLMRVRSLSAGRMIRAVTASKTQLQRQID